VENPKVMTFQDGLVSYEIQLEFEVFFFNIVKSYEVDPLFHALSHWWKSTSSRIMICDSDRLYFSRSCLEVARK
jgi:hypothetical protein